VHLSTVKLILPGSTCNLQTKMWTPHKIQTSSLSRLGGRVWEPNYLGVGWVTLVGTGNGE